MPGGSPMLWRYPLIACVGLSVLTSCVRNTQALEPPRRAEFHIDSIEDVRWPRERTLFVGTIRRPILPGKAAPMVALELDVNRFGTVPGAPRELIAMGGIADGVGTLADGSRALVSGTGRKVDNDEARAGAMLALAGVALEPDITDSRASTYPLVR